MRAGKTAQGQHLCSMLETLVQSQHQKKKTPGLEAVGHKMWPFPNIVPMSFVFFYKSQASAASGADMFTYRQRDKTKGENEQAEPIKRIPEDKKKKRHNNNQLQLHILKAL